MSSNTTTNTNTINTVTIKNTDNNNNTTITIDAQSRILVNGFINTNESMVTYANKVINTIINDQVILILL